MEVQAPPKKLRVEVKGNKRVVKKEKEVSPAVSYVYSADGGVHLDKDVHIVSDPNISLDELNSTTASTSVKLFMKTDSPPHSTEEVTTYLMEDQCPATAEAVCIYIHVRCLSKVFTQMKMCNPIKILFMEFFKLFYERFDYLNEIFLTLLKIF